MGIPIGLAQVAGRLRTRRDQIARETARFAEQPNHGVTKKKHDKNPTRTFLRHGLKLK